MRMVPVGLAFSTVNELLLEAERTATVTHDHPEGIRGAQAVAVAVFLATSTWPPRTCRTG
jgi:ADP-ribosylglycohydrolase